MINHITVMGRLTHDPTLRRTASGIAVCSFSVACERDYKDENGEKRTDFIDVVAWRNTAEFVSKYLTRGRMVAVDGRLQLRDWQDREGNKRRSAEILAASVNFGDSKPKDAASAQPKTPSRAPPDGKKEGVNGMLPRKIPSKITRKMIANFIEARCLGHADFARLVASSPRKNLLNCCRYIDRMARPYAEYDPETGSYYLDVTHRMCYAWAVDYYENPHAIEDWEGVGSVSRS